MSDAISPHRTPINGSPWSQLRFHVVGDDGASIAVPQPKTECGTKEGARPAKSPQTDPSTATPHKRVGPEYKADQHGLYMQKEVKLPKLSKGVDGGTVLRWHRIANFSAEIIEDIEVRRDYGGTQRVYVVEATTPNGPHRFELTAEAFSGTTWWGKELGSQASIEVAFNAADHVRNAIKQLSTPTPVVAYERVGWVEIDGEWRYCHAAGLIGPPGPNAKPSRATHASDPARDSAASGPNGPPGPRITSSLPAELQRYELPKPDRAGIVASRDIDLPIRMLMDLVHPVVAMLVGGAFRSVLGISEFSVFLVGGTGTHKTTLAMLIQQFFGRRFGRDSIPASWYSTVLSNLVKASIVRDAPLVIDDFAPTGSGGDVAQKHRDAENFLRSRSNLTARGRCGPDHQLKEGRRPYAVPLCTGEDLPTGESLRTRLAVVRVRKGDIPRDFLNTYQPLADNGTLATVMATFIEWVAAKRRGGGWAFLDYHKDWLRAEVDRVHPDLHGNQQKALIDLALGWMAYFDFRAEAIGQPHPEQLSDALIELIAVAITTHSAIVEDTDPAYRFCKLLLQAFDSCQAHLVSADNNRPLTEEEDAPHLGYRTEPYVVPRPPIVFDEKTADDELGAENSAGKADDEANSDDSSGLFNEVERIKYVPAGKRVGWLKGCKYYLLPEVAMDVVRRLASGAGDPLPLTQEQLGERLFDQGVIAGREPGRFTTRLMVNGKRKRCWQVSPEGVDRLMRRTGDYQQITCMGCLCNLLGEPPCERDCPEYMDV